jgi:sulfatase modifying factor 1
MACSVSLEHSDLLTISQKESRLRDCENTLSVARISQNAIYSSQSPHLRANMRTRFLLTFSTLFLLSMFIHFVDGIIVQPKDPMSRKPLSWSGLVAGVEGKMGDEKVKKQTLAGKTQTPVLVTGQIPAIDLFAAGTPLVKEVAYEIAPGVKMVFCYIPAGEAQLGSPVEEQDYIMNTFYGGERPNWLDAETESKRGKFKTPGFWLGKYPVTQGEWKALMGENPSAFDGRKFNKAKEMNTEAFPVECVNWYDCQIFLEKLNGRGGVSKIFGKSGMFALPHEDQWEYACRGGKGNKQAFFFGNQLNGTQANCTGSFPFGTDIIGVSTERTTAVGIYAAKYPHPWGLCDMHGNVLQWCNNQYGLFDNYVARGGSWHSKAKDCRSAYREKFGPGFRRFFLGCRVCLSLESE